MLTRPAWADSTINLSHDLTTLTIASQNLAPNQSTLDAGPLLLAAVQYAKTHAVTKITVDQGSYYFLSLDSTDSSGSHHAIIRSLANTTIDFAGSDLYFKENQKGGLYFVDCANVTLTNFTADYITPPFTQVRVTAVDAATRTITYQPIGNWPSPQAFNTVHDTVGVAEEVHLFFFRGGAKVQGVGNYISVVRPMTATTFQADSNATAIALAQVQPGDTALITLRGGVGGPVSINRGTNMNVNQVRIYAAGSIGLVDRAGTRNTFERVYVMPRPGTDRLISSNADGLSLADPRQGNVVRLSRSIRTGDDGFSPHSYVYGLVSQQASQRSVKIQLQSAPLPNGEHLVFEDADTGNIVADANLVSQDPVYSVNTAANTTITLTVDRDLGSLPGKTVVYTDDASFRGDGLTLERNLVQDSVFARGMTLWGLMNSTVRGNYMKRTAMDAISLLHRVRMCCDWETSALVNVSVRNNVIDQTGLHYGFSNFDKSAAIVAESLIADSGTTIRRMTAATPNTGIHIDNNYIADPQRSAVLMSSTASGSVHNNVFARPNNDPERDTPWGYTTDTGLPFAVDFRQPVVVKNATQIDVSGNQIEPWTVAGSVVDATGAEPIAVAPGSSATLRFAAPVTLAAGASATLTDADGTEWPLTIGASTATSAAVTVPAGAGLGGAYVTLKSPSVTVRGTLFVDSDTGDQFAASAARTILALTPNGTRTTGALLDSQGNGIGGASVNLSLERRAGAGVVATYTLQGTVPSNVTQGLFEVCINGNCGSAAADIDLYSAQYSDGNGQTTVDLTNGLTGWVGTLPTRLGASADGAFVNLQVSASQGGFLNSKAIALKAGSAYTLVVKARVPPSAVGAGYFTMIFGSPQEVSRDKLNFSATTSLGAVQTAGDGTFSVSQGVSTGAAELIATYAGTDTHWPQQTRASLPYAATGAVFSTVQSGSQSFLRFFNAGSAAGTATVTLRDYASGQQLGQWTSPSIPPSAEQQFAIGNIEAGASIGAVKPSYYALSIQPGLAGYFQHVLFRPSDGTLTNLSTCTAGVTADPAQLSGVHSSAVAPGFPSLVVISNTGSVAETVTLGIYDARDGSKLGTYTTASIPANGQAIPSVATLEAAAHIVPPPGMYHYVIKAEGAFTGYLQHLVNNTGAGVITDMTTACAFTGTGIAATSPLKDGAVFSTSQPASQSFLRFFNTGTTAGTVTVTLRNYTTGQDVGVWTSPVIPALSEQQFAIGSVEAAAGIAGAKPDYYSIGVQSDITGYFQHVLYRPTDGTLTNLSTCATGVTADAVQLGGVHTSTIGGLGFPSSIIISNNGSSAASVTLGLYDARNGVKLGTYSSASIPAGGQVTPAIADIEAAARIAPAADMYHYVIKAEGTFTGFLQHLVSNTKAGVVTDMTTACSLIPAGS